MEFQKLENLLDRLNSYGGKPLRIGHFKFDEGEADRYAAQLDMYFDDYIDDRFETEEEVLADIKRQFAETDDDSWMYDRDEDDTDNDEGFM